ncbi:MAG: nucleotide exchange factor GrpE [Candidatus Marinimicrobia bacterium]|jgi:molecular chaperone GrpE|nr:nucleotide exchange factor GrpE [Candidatus Neomarinimicrobiota bacterium]
MNKKIKNGSDSSSARVKAVPKKRMTKKDLEGVIKSLEDKQLRLKAEFDNFRKRKESEISALFKYDGKNFILDFLSILDNINRGIESYKDENTKKALLLIKEDFLKKMNNKEIKEFGKTGEIFNPELHEALTTTNLEDKKDDEIVEVYELGFKYKDLIVRHAKVVVNKK